MKKLATLLVMLSLGLFTIGCNDTTEPVTDTPPATEPAPTDTTPTEPDTEPVE